MLSFHGAGDSTGRLAEWDGLVELADSERFVVVHPQGSAVELFPGIHVDPGWDVLRLGVDGAHVGSAALLDNLALKLCIDTSRVYATGISNGGGLAVALSCTLADRIAAIAAGRGSPDLLLPRPQPVPTVMFHGLDDQFIPYSGDVTIGFPPIEQMASDVVIRNGCATTAPAVTAVAPGIDQLTWAHCTAPTELYRISSNGHAWPGGYAPPYTQEGLADVLQSSGAVPSTLTPEQAADNMFLSNPSIDANRCHVAILHQSTLTARRQPARSTPHNMRGPSRTTLECPGLLGIGALQWAAKSPR